MDNLRLRAVFLETWHCPVPVPHLQWPGTISASQVYWSIGLTSRCRYRGWNNRSCKICVWGRHHQKF